MIVWLFNLIVFALFNKVRHLHKTGNRIIVIWPDILLSLSVFHRLSMKWDIINQKIKKIKKIKHSKSFIWINYSKNQKNQKIKASDSFDYLIRFFFADSSCNGPYYIFQRFKYSKFLIFWLLIIKVKIVHGQTNERTNERTECNFMYIDYGKNTLF